MLFSFDRYVLFIVWKPAAVICILFSLSNIRYYTAKLSVWVAYFVPIKKNTLLQPFLSDEIIRIGFFLAVAKMD
jgi:hypothetical protein